MRRLRGVRDGEAGEKALQIEGEPSVEQALFIWKDSAAEFADCLICMRHLELRCQATASFEQRVL
jgi:predicted nucleic-acid-binding protein